MNPLEKILYLASAQEAVPSYTRWIKGKPYQVKGHTRRGSGASGSGPVPIPADLNSKDIKTLIDRMDDQRLNRLILVLIKALPKMKPSNRPKGILFLRALMKERSTRLAERSAPDKNASAPKNTNEEPV